MLVFAGFFLLGALLLGLNSPWGIGVYHDSAYYISAAQNLVAGEGLAWFGDGGELRTLTHFAPLYPLALAGGFALGIETDSVVRVIAALLYGGNIALLGWIIYHLTHHLWPGVLSSTLALLSVVILGVHLQAMSEPGFLLTTFTCLIALTDYIVSGERRSFFIAIALAALSYLTRYIGVVVLGTGALSLLLFGARPLRKRFQDALIFALTVFLPMALWMTRNYARTGSLTNRILRLHPPQLAKIKQFAATVVGWVSPYRLTAPGTFLILLGIAVLLGLFLYRLWRMRKTECDPITSFSGVVLIFALLYLASSAFSATFFDASTPFDDRILSPLYVTFLILFVLAIHQIHSEHRGWIALAMVLLVVLVNIQAPEVWDQFTRLREDGIGFTSQGWRESEIVAWVSSLPQGTTIYSNEKSALNFLTPQRVYAIPEKIDPVKAEVRDYYEESMQTMRERLSAPHAYLIVFHPGQLRVGMPTLEEITQELILFAEYADANVYVDPYGR